MSQQLEQVITKAEENGVSRQDFGVLLKAHVASLVLSEIVNEIAKILKSSKFSPLGIRTGTSLADR